MSRDPSPTCHLQDQLEAQLEAVSSLQAERDAALQQQAEDAQSLQDMLRGWEVRRGHLLPISDDRILCTLPMPTLRSGTTGAHELHVLPVRCLPAALPVPL